MPNPEITNVNSSQAFKMNCVFDDRSVEVAANTDLAVGTVLGIITQSTETNQGSYGEFSTAKSNGLEIPVAVLAQAVSNATGAAVKKVNVRVCLQGQVDGEKLVLANSATLNTLCASGKTVKDELKAEGIIALNIPQGNI
jgi:hypothetical protein